MAADISNYPEDTCSIPDKHVTHRTGKVPCELRVYELRFKRIQYTATP